MNIVDFLSLILLKNPFHECDGCDVKEKLQSDPCNRSTVLHASPQVLEMILSSYRVITKFIIITHHRNGAS